jgi:uncharacterized ion transporter superfamily protein YfcC
MEKKKTQKSAKKNVAKKAVVKKNAEPKIVAVKKEEAHIEKVAPVVTKSVKKNDHSLLKAVLITILIGVVLTWIIPSGTFSGATLTATTRTRTGINEFFLSAFYGANYYLAQLIFLVAIGIFYGVVSKTRGYNKMVDKIAKMWKGKEKLFVLVNSLIIALMASMLTQPLVTLVFIPMLFAVAHKLGLNKMTSIMMTFGAILVGLMGTTYGTYGVEYINSYMGTTASDGIGIHFIILIIGYLALNAYNFYMINKNKSALAESMIENEVEYTNKVKTWPYFVVFAILLVLSILGFTAWSTVFNVSAFTDFHTWLTSTLKIGSYPVIGYILGNISAFGSWDLFTIGSVMMVILIVFKFASKVSWDEIFDRAYAGIKVMVKPIILVTLAYAMFVICYWSGMTATMINWLNNLTNSFNPYLNAIGNAIATLFHVDFGYSGFLLGSFYAAKFADYTSQILTIMTSMNGLVGFIAPTSVIMLIGLAMTKTSYKEWINYIWKFVVGLLVVLFIIFSVITYL